MLNRIYPVFHPKVYFSFLKNNSFLVSLTAIAAVAIGAGLVFMQRKSELQNKITAPYQGEKSYEDLLRIFQQLKVNFSFFGHIRLSHPHYAGSCSLDDCMDRIDALVLENADFNLRERFLGLQMIEQINEIESKAKKLSQERFLEEESINHPGQKDRGMYDHPSFSSILTLNQLISLFPNRSLNLKESFHFNLPFSYTLSYLSSIPRIFHQQMPHLSAKWAHTQCIFFQNARWMTSLQAEQAGAHVSNFMDETSSLILGGKLPDGDYKSFPFSLGPSTLIM